MRPGDRGDPAAGTPPGPLSRFVGRAAARGAEGPGLLCDVAGEITAEVRAFTAGTVRWQDPENDGDPGGDHDPLPVITAMTGMAVTLVDVLSGFVELRAGHSARSAVC